ncbi:MAG TPA: serine/threonine-protein kinase [Polyangiaceae bacterium]|nr:serine/threonine-protein kinase [Polyangiaceae bacterium]
MEKTWLVIMAVLSLLAGVAALWLPLAGTALSVLVAVTCLYLLLHGADAGAPLESIEATRADAAKQGVTSLRSEPPRARSERAPAPSPTPPPAHASVPPGSSSIPPALGLSSYERLDKLAEGAMGELWLVRHVGLGRIAALKEIRGTEVNDEDVGRFTREAQVLSNLRCPHTIQVYDYGIGQDGFPFYVMEHLEGINLQQLVDKHGPMPAARAVHVLRQVCLSLQEAHEVGLVHRDIKPANIMLCRYGSAWDFVKLLDFGLVKRDRQQDSASLTRPAVVLGTPAYVAPESLRGSKYVDGRADLYAVGAVGHFLLTGRLLFNHDQPVAMARAHLLEPAPRVSDRVQVPRELDDLLDECLRKEPEQRPASARQLVERLERVPLEAPWSQAQAEEWWLKMRPQKGRARRVGA